MPVLKREGAPDIAYDVAGDGPPVVLVHGLTSMRQRWGPVSELLARDLTCVRVDLRGHGESGTAREYSMPSLAGDVHAVVEALDLRDPAIVGHSLGATVAAVHAVAFGARAVVCVDSSLRFGDLARLVQSHAGTLRGDRTMEAVVEIEHALDLGPYTGIADLERRVRAFPREILLGVWAALLTTPPDELTATAEALLPRITAPLLSLHGSPPPPDYEAWLTALVPRARVEVWDGTGHMLHLVDPERFAGRVRRAVADAAGHG